jgi:hypothetical protein
MRDDPGAKRRAIEIVADTIRPAGGGDLLVAADVIRIRARIDDAGDWPRRRRRHCRPEEVGAAPPRASLHDADAIARRGAHRGHAPIELANRLQDDVGHRRLAGIDQHHAVLADRGGDVSAGAGDHEHVAADRQDAQRRRSGARLRRLLRAHADAAGSQNRGREGERDPNPVRSH